MTIYKISINRLQLVMGGGSSIQYTIPVTQKPEGESAVYRFPQFKHKLLDRPEQHLLTMKDVLINTYKKYGNSEALGRIIRTEKDASIEFMTYKQVVLESQYIGSAILNKKLFSQPQNEKFKFVGIFSKNRQEWSIVDMACWLYNLTTVPIYDTLGDENITYVFKHTQLTTCFVSELAVKGLMKCHDLVHVKTLVCYDPFTQEQATYFKEKGVELMTYEQLLKAGKGAKVDYNQPEYKVQPNDCLTFSYTSGTTGPPKGAMISHRNFTSFIAATQANEDARFTSEDVGLSYLPLPHILEREFVLSMFYAGAKIVYFGGDVQKLKDDLAIVKPTVFVSVPRLFSRFYEAMKAKMDAATGMSKTLLDYALSVKLQNLKNSGSYKHRVYDRFVFSKTREALGGRCRLMISGSAPLLPEVQNFLKVTMCAPLCEGYGQTESTGAMLFSSGADPEVRHVGGPTCNFEVKFVDIPEMNYRSTDKDSQGRLAPRGQIWARGPGVFLGYYHDEVKTEEAITKDGWLRTGDVGEMNGVTGAIKIIDRKKNIFKLQQGEYVAAEKVENIYMKGDKLAEIFLHGESTETFVIVIAVPHKKAVDEFAHKRGIQGSFEQLCKNELIRCDFVNYLNKVGKENGLQGFEQVKNIFLQPQSFMVKGLVTTTMKVQRHEAKNYYKAVIVQLYKEGMLKTDKK